MDDTLDPLPFDAMLDDINLLLHNSPNADDELGLDDWGDSGSQPALDLASMLGDEEGGAAQEWSPQLAATATAADGVPPGASTASAENPENVGADASASQAANASGSLALRQATENLRLAVHRYTKSLNSVKMAQHKTTPKSRKQSASGRAAAGRARTAPSAGQPKLESAAMRPYEVMLYERAKRLASFQREAHANGAMSASASGHPQVNADAANATAEDAAFTGSGPSGMKRIRDADSSGSGMASSSAPSYGVGEDSVQPPSKSGRYAPILGTPLLRGAPDAPTPPHDLHVHGQPPQQEQQRQGQSAAGVGHSGIHPQNLRRGGAHSTKDAVNKAAMAAAVAVAAAASAAVDSKSGDRSHAFAQAATANLPNMYSQDNIARLMDQFRAVVTRGRDALPRLNQPNLAVRQNTAFDALHSLGSHNSAAAALAAANAIASASASQPSAPGMEQGVASGAAPQAQGILPSSASAKATGAAPHALASGPAAQPLDVHGRGADAAGAANAKSSTGKSAPQRRKKQNRRKKDIIVP